MRTDVDISCKRSTNAVRFFASTDFEANERERQMYHIFLHELAIFETIALLHAKADDCNRRQLVRDIAAAFSIAH